MYFEREAELKERVDRRRVRIAWLGEGEGRELAAAIRDFRDEIAALDAARREKEIELDTVCEVGPLGEAT